MNKVIELEVEREVTAGKNTEVVRASIRIEADPSEEVVVSSLFRVLKKTVIE